MRRDGRVAERNAMTAERLRDLLNYDPASGVFTRRVTRGTRRVCTSPDSYGYPRIRVGGFRYSAHRLAFLWMTGEWPPEQVDHIDMDRANNRWANLRPCSCAENKRNSRKHADGTSGFKGVYWIKAIRKWQAGIRVNGRSICLGYTDTPEAAAALYAAAAREHHGAFARTE